MNLRLTTYNLRLILIPMLICGLLTLDCGLLYGQDDYLNVKGNTKANTIIFAGNMTAYPVAPLEGEVFYNAQEKNPRYFDGTFWKKFGGPKTVATKIVAASDTPDGASRADYVCDGTDDQVEIQAAIDAIEPYQGSLWVGGAVYLLEGTYNISSPINLDNTAPNDSGKAIIGTGRGTVLKVVSGATNVYVINASGTATTSLSRILISQLMIDMTQPGGTSYSWHDRGINFSYVTYSKIDKVWLENIPRYSEGIFFYNSSNNTISNNHVLGSGGWAQSAPSIYIYPGSNNIVSQNNVRGNGYDIYINGSNNVASYNNVQSNGADGIAMGGSNNIISHNNVQGNGIDGIHSWGSNNIISHNNVQGNAWFGIWLASFSNGTISGNNVQGNTRNGILSQSSSNNVITGNVIYNNGADVNWPDGIMLQDSDNNIISSNRLYDSTGSGYGINISANTCDNNYLIGNLIDGAGYSGRLIQDLGTGTKYTDKAKMTLERKQISSGFSPLNVTTSPQTYVALNPSADTTLTFAENGSSVAPAAGALLILENVSTSTTIKVTINDNPGGNVNLGAASRELYQYDILRLIWNGSRWLETEYVNN